MKNFDYLKDYEQLKELYGFCSNAEDAFNLNHVTSAMNGRLALEWLVRQIYQMKGIAIDEKDSLYELMVGEPFAAFIADDKMMMAAHHIRKIGNQAVHQGSVKGGQAFFALLNLYDLVGFVLLKLQVINELQPFNRDLIPLRPDGFVVTLTQTNGQAETHLAAEPSFDYNALPDDYTEAETRRYFIDLMLEEAGWEVLEKQGVVMPSKACIEIELEGMPNNQGLGYADYVLFGANGKPLAVVEAKRTTKDAVVGRHQAELYADCLEKKYGQRPVVYYTNGFRTFIIDGLGYPPRMVFGYHTEADLNVLLQRRKRNDITDFYIKDHITDREYQKRAIKAVCEHFNTKHRKGLLVMATGTGKTRVSISLCDVLMRNGWVKNILFLADRTALVKQAAKNFVKLLPNATTCILSEDKQPDMSARIMFCTYQTMIKFIDADTKEFSVGRFDLVLIDEAHRSVFGKYSSILSYFDCLMVGLTATPRDEVDRSTYDLFELESGEPNFAYELNEAVADGYLVNYNVLPRTTHILQEGIKYESLSKEEKEQLEAVWQYEKAKHGLLDFKDDDPIGYHRDIENKEIFKYIFNEDTIDKVLIDLMTNGLKVNSGENIGKTVIFAYNHEHAELIVKRFCALYPQYGPDYCQLIDNYVNYAQDLIEAFEVRGKLPQIAVSVDMLDTGIDVPDILNLVFFKPVHSMIKFWQMIGRGTRLSPNIFDVGKDKTEFYIFDWCGNFEFFGKHPKGKEPLPVVSLTERLFGLRCDLAFALQHSSYQNDAVAKKLHDDTKDLLRQQVIGLNDNHIYVRQNWEMVDKFRKEPNWAYISTVDVQDLKDRIAPLLVSDMENEAAKKFDVLLVHIELSMVDVEVTAEGSKIKVEEVAKQLQEKSSIPQVAAKMPLINELVHHDFWEHATLDRLEYVRMELRELVKFILGTDNRTFTIDIADVVETGDSMVGVAPIMTYRQRVIDYLARNRDLPVLRKIFNMEKLSEDDIKALETICWEELGTKEEYQRYVEKGNMICGDSVAAFIRAQIGVDRVVAVSRYSKFISVNNLNAMQEEYLKTIITYVCENGDISINTIINESPFCDYEIQDLFGEDAVGVGRYIKDFHDLIA